MLDVDRKVKLEQWLAKHKISQLSQIYSEPWGEMWRAECDAFGSVVVQILAESEKHMVKVFNELSNNTAHDISFTCQKVHAFNEELGVCIFEDLSQDVETRDRSVMRSTVIAIYGAIQAHFSESRTLEKIMPRALAMDVLNETLRRVEGPVEGDKTNLFMAMPGDDAEELRATLLSRRSQLEGMAKIIDAQVATINHTNLSPANFHLRAGRKLCLIKWDDAVLSAPGWSLFMLFDGVTRVHKALHSRDELKESDEGMGDMRAMDSYLDILRRSINIEEMDRLIILPRAAVFGLFYHISTYFKHTVTTAQSIDYGNWTKQKIIDLLEYLEIAETLPEKTPESTETVPAALIRTQADAHAASQMFRKNGCLVIKDAVPKAVINELNASLSDGSENHAEAIKKGHALEVGNQRFMLSPDLSGPFGDPKVIAAPRVMGVLDFLFNISGFILGSAVVVTSFPGAKAQLMHRDNVDLFPEVVNMDTPPFLVSVVIPLVPLTKDVGGTELVLRSHIHRSPEEPDAPRVLPELELGDAFLMDARLLHRGMPNVSDKARPIIIMCYQRQWYKDFQNFLIQPALRFGDKALDRLPEQRKRLLQHTTYPK